MFLGKQSKLASQTGGQRSEITGFALVSWSIRARGEEGKSGYEALAGHPI